MCLKSDVFCLITYSYYLPNYNQTPNYQVISATGELDNSRYLGISNHKITLNSCLHLPEKRWKLNTTFMYFSDKYTYLFHTNTPDLVLTAFRPEFHFNMAFHYKLADDLNLMLAAYNILGQNLWFVNPYDSGDNPIPEQRQEFLLRLSYKINAK